MNRLDPGGLADFSATGYCEGCATNIQDGILASGGGGISDGMQVVDHPIDGGNGGDSGGAQAPDPLAKYTQKCQNAIRADQQTANAIDRATAAQSVLQKAAISYGLDWRLLAAIGIRESGFQDINQPDGAGVGVFQITPNGRMSTAGAHNLDTAAGYAASILRTAIDYYSAIIQEYGLDPNAIAARGYNTGPYNRYTLSKAISGNPIAALDLGTAHNNYVSNVLALMDCFK